MFKTDKIIFLLLFTAFILSGCGNEPPIISNIVYNILIYQEGSMNTSSNSIFLSVFFDLDDENGMDDIKDVRIIHTETDYSWLLGSQYMINEVVWNEQSYVGYSFLEFENAKSILLGEYLISVEDKAGNVVEAPFYVEIDGKSTSGNYKIPEIKYKTELINDNKELKITQENYSSCEIKVLNKPDLFDGTRKKFKKGKKILISNEPLKEGDRISIRINKDDNESIVYFLKLIII